MKPLPQDASTRRKEDIDSIRHVHLDLDHAGLEAVELVETSSDVPPAKLPPDQVACLVAGVKEARAKREILPVRVQQLRMRPATS